MTVLCRAPCSENCACSEGNSFQSVTVRGHMKYTSDGREVEDPIAVKLPKDSSAEEQTRIIQCLGKAILMGRRADFGVVCSGLDEANCVQVI